MRSFDRLRMIGPVLLSLMWVPGGASAFQDDRPATVIGYVTDDVSGTPVVGAFVTLIDADGERVAGSLADDDGRFVMRSPPGRLRLQIQRIGIATVVSEPFDVGPGQVVTRNLAVAIQAVSLDGFEVSAEAQCDIRRDGGEAMAIWDEARKALDVAAWSDDLGLYTYTSDNWRREFGPNGRTLVSEARERQVRPGQQAFRSLPADSLERVGYAFGDDDNRYYYAPDANVLLSDSFLRTHCFRAVEDDGVYGLRFEPVPDREVADIEGTLWLNESGLLDRLEFEYVNLDGEVRSARTTMGFRATNLGGQVQFEGLETGGWIVREWQIRMPAIGVELDRNGEVRRRFLSGIVEVGAEVVSAEAQTAVLRFPPDRAAVRGFVTDSTSGRALAGAIAYITGVGRSATSGDDGAFLVEDLLPGEYTLTVEHPTRMTLGAPPITVAITASAGEVVDVGVVSYPSRREVLAQRCEGVRPIELEGAFEREGELAIVGGMLMTAEGIPLADGAVRVRWIRDGVTTAVDWRGIEVRSNARGAWVVCGVPTGARIAVETYDVAGELMPAYQVGQLRGGARVWLTLDQTGG